MYSFKKYCLKKSGTFLSAAVLLLSMFSLLLIPAPLQAAALSGKTTVYNLGTGYYNLRTVDIEKYDSNNLVVAWRNQYSSSKGDMGDIMYAYSSDGGSTWSAAQTMVQHDATWAYGNVILYQDRGMIYAFVGRVPATASSSETQKLIAFKSTDKGVTWSSHTLTLGYTGTTIGGGKIVKHSGVYLMPFHTNDGTRIHGVLKSTDLSSWSLAGTIPNSSGAFLQEGFIAEDQDNASNLVIKMRAASGGYVYSSSSTDNGTTWSNAVQDTNIPNYNAKGFFAKDSNGQYITIYNTASDRNTLYFKTKKPGASWTTGQLFADDSGWDTYTMAIEYSPGKFYAAWENSLNKVMFQKIDLDATAPLVDTQWDSTGGWSISNDGGTVEINPAGQLHLLNQQATVSKIYTGTAPASAPFTLEFRAQVADYTVNDPTTAVSLGAKVATGSRRLMIALQADGVYSMTSSTAGWSKVYSMTGDTGWHTWKIAVDSSWNATLYKDGGAALATWQIQTNTVAATTEHWVTGTTSNAAEARVDWTKLTAE
ncbi:sialidase family protein [Paenibacillus thalictri]|nr:sialidase family protein [Paenibacillus thalictri]